MSRKLPHDAVGCWCTFEHSQDGECLHAQWLEDAKIIYRCHAPAVEGQVKCLLHLETLSA